VPIKPQYLVRGEDGRPLPPTELVEKLRQFDPRIGLFYTNAAWAITEAWTEEDPRRARIQAGEMQPEFAFDIAGYLPVTCSLDEALPYIERELRNHTAESFAALRYTAQHWNEVTQPAMLEETMRTAVDDDMHAMNIVSKDPGRVSVISDISPRAARRALQRKSAG
jgi:hypothetical protein